MDNKIKKVIILTVLIIIFILVFVFFALFLNGRINFLGKEKSPKNYLNIDKNKVIENPTKEDVKNLIDTIQDSGEF